MKKQEVIDLASRRGLCVYEQYKGRKVYYKVRIPVFEDEKEIPTSYRDELVRNIKEVNSVTDNGISETQYQESNERGCRRKENHRMAARGA